MRLVITIAVILLSGVKSRAQNPLWDSLGAGFPEEIKMLYYDSVTSTLIMGNRSIQTQDGLSIYGVASWNGTQWDSLGCGFKPLGPFGGSLTWWASSACRFNGELYFGGNFEAAGGKPINRIAKWNGTNWDSLPTHPNSIIYDMLVYHGKLYVCGDFTQIGNNTNLKYIAAWNGSSWEQVGNGITSIIEGISTNPDVAKFCVYNDELYVAGIIEDTNSNPIHIVRWNDTAWNYVGTGIQQGGVGMVYDMVVYDNELWIGGWFSAAATGTSDYITRWNGSQFKSVGGVGFDSPVYSLFTYSGRLYAGGIMQSINGLPVSSIATFDGQQWCGLPSDLSLFGVTQMEVFNDSLVIAGNGNKIDTTTFHNIASWAGGSLVDSCKNANIGVEENFDIELQKITVYPNPNAGSFNVTASSNRSDVELKIYDAQGHLVYSEKYKNIFSQTPIGIQLQNKVPGLYLLSIENDTGRFTSKILIE